MGDVSLAPPAANARSRAHGRVKRVREAAGQGLDRDEAEALARVLRRRIAGEVRFDSGSRALYAADASNYRQVPIGVVIPRSIDDVVATVELCRHFGAPVLPRGTGTGLAGQTCNVAVVIDFRKYVNRILDIDPLRSSARVEPGVVLDALRDAAERFHLTFGPDPATHSHNTLGGMLGNNSCGVHSVMAGRTSDNVRSMEALTYDGLRLRVGPTSDEECRAIVAQGGRRGEIYRRLDALRRRYGDLIRQRYPNIPRRISGYNLPQLLPENGFNVARALVGSEGTCVTVLDATLDLVHSPPARVLVLAGFRDVFEAADHVPQVLAHGPIGLEGMDQLLIDFMRKKHLREEHLEVLPEGEGWLLVEFGGESEAEAVDRARRMMDDLGRQNARPRMRLIRDKAEQARVWLVRESGLGATAYVPGHPEAWEGWEDSAVPPERLGDYLRDLKALFRLYGYDSVLYGHFGDGCVHCRINFDLRTEPGVATFRRFLDDATDLVLRYGGSYSGEHGDGQSRAELLGKMYGPELMEVHREFKAIWDPEGKMNPGKVVDPYPITSNLRVGPSYRPPALDTRYAYIEDHRSFAHATMRCVGVGKCVRADAADGVMCPSYMVTRDERDSTRGRAHALFEMIHGGPLTKGWQSDEVEETLHLCLACKGCKSDCPVNVDIATYKSEFRAHYYAGRLRPRAAYSMGLIYWWSRAASRVPHLANLVNRTPGLSAGVKRVGGIAPQRTIPRYAETTFRSWFARRRPPNPDGPPVVLFPDCFNNFFRPATAVAATRVLEAAGWNVRIPGRILCCGRPLYDWGMLGPAKRLLWQTLDTLRDDIRDGVPMVGLEPACVSAYRDELVNLLPRDDARRLRGQTFLLDEFIDRCGDEFPLPKDGRRALVQTHCHHHAILTPEAERRVLGRLAADAQVMPSGCCGMAGAFGFEADKYEVSMRAAERVMLPLVRTAPRDTTIIANGFSCREQIEQGTGRGTVHLAEFLAEAMGLPRGMERSGASIERSLVIAGSALAFGIAAGAWAGRRRQGAAAGGTGRRPHRWTGQAT